MRSHKLLINHISYLYILICIMNCSGKSEYMTRFDFSHSGNLSLYMILILPQTCVSGFFMEHWKNVLVFFCYFCKYIRIHS